MLGARRNRGPARGAQRVRAPDGQTVGGKSVRVSVDLGSNLTRRLGHVIAQGTLSGEPNGEVGTGGGHMENDERGGLGEDLFRTWCRQAEMTAVQSVPDKFGWDYHVTLHEPKTGRGRFERRGTER